MTRESTFTNCVHCRAPLDPDDPNTFIRYEAWGRKSATPSRRAGSDLYLREPVSPLVVCCSTCVAQIRRGVAPMQATLMGEAA